MWQSVVAVVISRGTYVSRIYSQQQSSTSDDTFLAEIYYFIHRFCQSVNSRPSFRPLATGRRHSPAGRRHQQLRVQRRAAHHAATRGRRQMVQLERIRIAGDRGSVVVQGAGVEEGRPGGEAAHVGGRQHRWRGVGCRRQRGHAAHRVRLHVCNAQQTTFCHALRSTHLGTLEEQCS